MPISQFPMSAAPNIFKWESNTNEVIRETV